MTLSRLLCIFIKSNMQPTFKTHEPWFATKTHFIMMKFKIKGPEIYTTNSINTTQEKMT